MNFVAWQKISLVDYPGLIATLLFTGKCNFWCEYCHNKSLKYQEANVREKDVFDFIESKRGKIDALCITGGEPSLYKDEMFDFVSRVKSRFPYIKIKTDTNGSDPEYIKTGIEYFDYVAMDFKSMDYSKFSNEDFQTVLNSLKNLYEYRDYEVRITVYPPYVPIDDFERIAKVLSEAKNVVIQQYRPVNDVKAYDFEILQTFCSHFRGSCVIR